MNVHIVITSEGGQEKQISLGWYFVSIPKSFSCAVINYHSTSKVLAHKWYTLGLYTHHYGRSSSADKNEVWRLLSRIGKPLKNTGLACVSTVGLKSAVNGVFVIPKRIRDYL